MDIAANEITAALHPVVEFHLVDDPSGDPNAVARPPNRVLHPVFSSAALVALGIILLESLTGWRLSGVGLIVAVIIGLLLSLLIARMPTRLRRAHSHSARPEIDPENSAAKVICYLNRVELEAFRGVNRELFEPIVIRYVTAFAGCAASRFRRRHGDSIFMLSVLGPVGAALVNLYVGVSLGVALIALFYLPTWVYPSYLRASPGLLEILRGRWWSPRVEVVKRINIANARLRVRLDECGVYVVGDRETDTVTTTVGLASFGDPCDAAVAIVRAAIAPAGNAPLPESSLCG